MIRWRYPLAWPAGKARTPYPEESKFSNDGKAISFAVGRDRLITQLERLGANDVEISINIKFTLAGKRDMNISRVDPADRGVAVYFKLNGQSVELACDRWYTIGQNMAAIAAHIDALRGQERWGVGSIKTAFAGHLALPAPLQRKHWTAVLGISSIANEDLIHSAWRKAAQNAGSDAALMDINVARDEALAENGYR